MILVQIETQKISVFFKNLNVTNFRTAKQLWLIFMAAKAKPQSGSTVISVS